MSKCSYSINHNDIQYTAIKPTKKFINEIIRYIPTVTFTKKSKIIKTTDRTSVRNDEVFQLRANSNLERQRRVIYGSRFAVRKNLVEIQTYSFTRSIVNKSDPREEIEIRLVNIASFNNISGKTLKINSHAMNNMGWYAEEYAENQLNKIVFRNTFLKYVSHYINDLKSYRTKSIVDQVERVFKYRNEIETLDNLNAVNISRAIVNGNEDMRVITLKFLKENKKWLKRGLSVKNIKELPVIKKYYKMNDQNINKVINGTISESIITEIRNYESSNSIRANKLLRYIDKQGCTLEYYSDYKNMLSELDMDTDYWSYLYPKNIFTSHDRLVERVLGKNPDKVLLTLLKSGHIEKYKNRYHILKELEVKTDKYSLIVPKSHKEIIKEGKLLNHCVSGISYLKKHTNESLIMFVRKNSSLNTPYFTIEISKKGKVIQLHGYGNEGKSELGMVAKKEKPKVNDFVNEVMSDLKYKELIIEKFDQIHTKN